MYRALQHGICWLAALAVVSPPVPVHAAPAQEAASQGDLSTLSLEQLLELQVRVSSASTYAQDTLDAPSSVTVITADDIRKHGYRTLGEVVSGVRGFFTTYDRNYTYLGVRGFARPGDYNSRVLLLIDGWRVNDNLYGYAGLGTDAAVDVDLIERIEVIRGPTSSVYGTGAFFGVINVITRSPEDSPPLELSTGIGSFETVQGRLTLARNGGTEGTSALLSATVMDSDGQGRLFFPELDDPSTGGGIARGVDDDGAFQLLGKASRGELAVNGVVTRREKGVPTAPWGTVFNDPRTRTWDTTAWIDATWSRRLADGSELWTQAGLSTSRYDGDYVYDYSEDPAEPDLVVNRDEARGTWWSADTRYTRPLPARQKLVVGAFLQRNLRQDQRNFDVDVYLDDGRSSTDWALYAQDEIRLHDRLIVNLGIRHDDHGFAGGFTSPRLAAILRLGDSGALKLLYGRAFRAPNVFELFYADGESQVRPDALAPEEIRTWEVVWEQLLQGTYRTVVSAYRYDIEGLINQETTPDELIVFANLGEVRAVGLEAEVFRLWPGGVEAGVSYSIQSVEDEATGEPLSNSPRHLVIGEAQLPVLEDRAFASVGGRYIGARRTLAGDVVGDTFVGDLTLWLPGLLPGLDASLSVHNFLDTRYADPGAEEHLQDRLFRDGRTFRFEVTWSPR